MIKIVTSSEMRELDRKTIEAIGLPAIVLMERAGSAVARVIREKLADVAEPIVFVFCGKGNNGGDGFVVARHLWEDGILVETFCTVAPEQLKGEAAINCHIAGKLGIPLTVISSGEDLLRLNGPAPDLIVDALLGTGISGPVRGTAKEIIEFINDWGAPVVALDIPSGLDADSGRIAGETIQAEITVALALPKQCHVFNPARQRAGELYIADIGIPSSLRQDPGLWIQMVEEEDIAMPYREVDAHKYRCGRVAVVAGSAGFTGAAVLTASGAQKIGAGLVKAAIPKSLNPILEEKLTEVITVPVRETDHQTIGPESLREIKSLCQWADVVAIGPGLGRSHLVQSAVLELLADLNCPVVVDADALFALAEQQDLLRSQGHSNWVLTPHLGEFCRFFPETEREQVRQDPIGYARNFAVNFQVYLLLKGAPAALVSPDGEVFVNPTGNPALASGGTGDVLTGFIAGLMAQGLAPQEAAISGNYIHGAIADQLAEERTVYTVNAGDLIQNLPNTLKKLNF